MRRLLAAVIGAVGGVALPSLLQAEARLQESMAFQHACQPAESWRFPERSSGALVPEVESVEFRRTLTGATPPVQGFARALAFRRKSWDAEARAFGEYWMARALFASGLYRASRDAFESLGARATPVVQTAALECLLVLQQRFPSFALPEIGSAELEKLLGRSPSDSEMSVVWKYAGAMVRQLLAENKSDGALKPYLTALVGAGDEEHLAQGLFAVRKSRHMDAVTLLSKAVDRPNASRYKAQIRLLLARSYYALKQFDRAAHELKKIDKSSNELAQALSEMGWSALREGKKGEAIGVAVSLSAGVMRRTFAPESAMVMAMALNELCQYPESLRAISLFQRSYDKSYQWLAHRPKSGSELYPMAVQYLRSKSGVPDKIGGEWLRSPVFISHQEELNLMESESKSAEKARQTGSSEQHKKAAELKAKAAELVARVRGERKSGKGLSRKLLQDVQGYRESLATHQDLRSAAEPWRQIVETQKKRSADRRKALVSAIEADLRMRTERMRTQLEEIHENNQLIEVEIFSGATRDIVWQNAHPDYQEFAKRLSEREKNADSGKVWNWGTAPIGSDRWSEIWEDEIGSFKSSLFDNCASKEKYLAIQKSMIAGS